MKFPALKNDQKGQALLLVLLMTAAILLVGSAALTMGTTVRKTAVHEVSQDKAFYIAEAGVEKVLAEAKRGPVWLKNLSLNQNYDFIAGNLGGEVGYAGGTFEKIIVRKLSEDAGTTILEIESWGKYRESIRKVKVNVELKFAYAENLFRGVWVNSSNVPGGHGVNFTTDSYFSNGDIKFTKGSKITGDIYCRGKVTLESKSQGQGNDKNITEVTGNIYALGGVSNDGNEKSKINGDVYVDDESKVDRANLELDPNKIHVLSTAELSAMIPSTSDFPELLSEENLAWYKNNADYRQLPPMIGNNRNFAAGIYYLEGDQRLSGTYTGNATIVIKGNVTLGDLTRKDNNTNYSLTILATGKISIQSANNQEIHALLYSKEEVEFKNDTTLKGSILSPTLSSKGNQITVIRDGEMINRYKEVINWSTCFVRINKWSE